MTETDRNRQQQTETDSNRQRQTEKDNDRQRHTETDRNADSDERGLLNEFLLPLNFCRKQACIVLLSCFIP